MLPLPLLGGARAPCGIGLHFLGNARRARCLRGSPRTAAVAAGPARPPRPRGMSRAPTRSRSASGGGRARTARSSRDQFRVSSRSSRASRQRPFLHRGWRDHLSAPTPIRLPRTHVPLVDCSLMAGRGALPAGQHPITLPAPGLVPPMFRLVSSIAPMLPPPAST